MMQHRFRVTFTDDEAVTFTADDAEHARQVRAQLDTGATRIRLNNSGGPVWIQLSNVYLVSYLGEVAA